MFNFVINVTKYTKQHFIFCNKTELVAKCTKASWEFPKLHEINLVIYVVINHQIILPPEY